MKISLFQELFSFILTLMKNFNCISRVSWTFWWLNMKIYLFQELFSRILTLMKYFTAFQEFPGLFHGETMNFGFRVLFYTALFFLPQRLKTKRLILLN